MMIEYWNQYGYEQEPERSKRKQTVERGDDQREQQVKQKYDPNIGTEAGQRTDAHLTNPSTNRPTNGIWPKNTTASDRKIVQRDDSVPCLGKKFSMTPSDLIENSADDTI